MPFVVILAVVVLLWGLEEGSDGLVVAALIGGTLGAALVRLWARVAVLEADLARLRRGLARGRPNRDG